MPLTARGSSTMEGDEPAKPDPASMPKGVVLDEVALQLEEERRLAYVACSRAKVQLNLSFILTDSTGAVCQPSRFLNEMPSDAMSEATATPSTTALAAGASGGAACEYMRLLVGAAGAGKTAAAGGCDGGGSAVFRAPNSTAASTAAFTTPRPKAMTAFTSAAAATAAVTTTTGATPSPAKAVATSASPCPTMPTSAASPQPPPSTQAAAIGNVTPFRSPFAMPKLAAASTSISCFPSSSAAASTAVQVAVAAASATADAAIAASDRHANALLLAGRQRFRPLTASVPPIPHTASATLTDSSKATPGASVTTPLSLSVQKPPRVPAQQPLQSQVLLKPTEVASAIRIDDGGKDLEDEDIDDASLTTTAVKHGSNADSAANEWASVASQASHVMFRPRIPLLPGAVSSFSSSSSSFTSSASGLGFASKPFVGLAAMMNAGAGGALAPAAAASPSSCSTASSDAASPSSLKRAAPPTAGGADAGSPDAKRAAVSLATTPTAVASPRLPRSILLSGPRIKPMHM